MCFRIGFCSNMVNNRLNDLGGKAICTKFSMALISVVSPFYKISMVLCWHLPCEIKKPVAAF